MKTEDILLALFIRYGLPYLLRREVLTAAEALAVKIWYEARQVKTYPDYNIQKNGAKTIKPVATGQKNGTINH